MFSVLYVACNRAQSHTFDPHRSDTRKQKFSSEQTSKRALETRGTGQPRNHSTTNNQSKHYPRFQIPPTHIINPVRLLQAELPDSSTAAMRPVQEMYSSFAREAKPCLKCGLPSKLCDWFHLPCTLPSP